MASRLLAGLAALLTVGVLVAVFAITREQGDSPARWFVALLALAIAGLGYGATAGALGFVASALTGFKARDVALP